MFRRLFSWAAGIALAVLGAWILLGPVLLGGNWRTGVAPPPADLALSVVRFRAPDGLPLVAWMADAETPKAVVVLISGLGGNRTVAPVPAMMRDLSGRGYSVLALDLRGQGSSGDDPGPPGFGTAQARDVTAAVDWLIAHRTGLRVAALGLGSGAVVALDAAAIDPRIEGLVLQDAATDPRRALGREVAALTDLPAGLIGPMLWSAEHLWGIEFGRSHPLDAMAQYAPRPALLIHGDGMAGESDALTAANPRARNWAAGATGDYQLYREAWVDQVAGFLDGLFGTMFG